MSRTSRTMVAVALAIPLAACAALLSVDDVRYDADASIAGDAATDGESPADAGLDAIEAALPACELDPPSFFGDAGDASAQCSGGSANLLTSPLNCGRCDHACPTNDCRAGVCVPERLAPPGTARYGLAVGAGYLYAILTGALPFPVYRLSLDGGVEESLGGTTIDARLIHADDRSLVVRSYDSVATLSLDGGGGPTVFTPSIGPGGLAVTSDTIYAASASFNDTPPSTIAVFSRDGGARPSISAPAGRPFELAATADAGELFWLARNSADGGPPNGGLYHFTANGGSQPIGPPLEDPVGLALDRDAVYFGTVSGILRRYSFATRSLDVVGDTRDAGFHVATQVAAYNGYFEQGLLLARGEHLFWIAKTEYDASYPTYLLVKQRRCGGPLTVIADLAFDAPYGLAVDDAWAYWITANGIWRVPH